MPGGEIHEVVPISPHRLHFLDPIDLMAMTDVTVPVLVVDAALQLDPTAGEPGLFLCPVGGDHVPRTPEGVAVERIEGAQKRRHGQF